MDPADIDIMMGTFTKSFGSCGGYIAANRCSLAADLGTGVMCSLMGMYAGLVGPCSGWIPRRLHRSKQARSRGSPGAGALFAPRSRAGSAAPAPASLASAGCRVQAGCQESGPLAHARPWLCTCSLPSSKGWHPCT